jgi:hypothetical protein
MAAYSLDTLTCEDFQPHIGSSFTVSDESGAAVQITLTEAATSERSWARWMKRMPFHLLFDAPPEVVIPNEVFLLSHPVMGEIGRVLVTPTIDSDRPGGRLFQVIFN